MTTTVDPLAPALQAVRRAAADDRRACAQAAYEVGYERGFLTGYETAERDHATDPEGQL